MFVVALPRFVIEPEHAHLVDDQRQPVFEAVIAPADRTRQTPDHDIGKTVFAEDASFTEQQLRRHVGAYANTFESSIAWPDSSSWERNAAPLRQALAA